LRFATQDIDVKGTVYIVQTGLVTYDVLKTLSRFRLYLLMFAPLLLLVAAGGGYWLSRRALSPVDALVRTARSITGTTLSSRLEKLNTGDELQRLSDTLNEMLDRIELCLSPGDTIHCRCFPRAADSHLAGPHRGGVGSKKIARRVRI